MLSVVRQLETTLSCLLKPQLSLIFYFFSSDSVLSFSLSCVCLGLNTSECLSSSSAVVFSALSANLSEPQRRRPLPGLNSKENRIFPKLGRPMKSENEDGESEKKNHGKYNPKKRNQRKGKDDRRRREGGEGGWEGKARWPHVTCDVGSTTHGGECVSVWRMARRMQIDCGF